MHYFICVMYLCACMFECVCVCAYARVCVCAYAHTCVCILMSTYWDLGGTKTVCGWCVIKLIVVRCRHVCTWHHIL